MTTIMSPTPSRPRVIGPGQGWAPARTPPAPPTAHARHRPPAVNPSIAAQQPFRSGACTDRERGTVPSGPCPPGVQRAEVEIWTGSMIVSVAGRTRALRTRSPQSSAPAGRVARSSVPRSAQRASPRGSSSWHAARSRAATDDKRLQPRVGFPWSNFLIGSIAGRIVRMTRQVIARLASRVLAGARKVPDGVDAIAVAQAGAPGRRLRCRSPGRRSSRALIRSALLIDHHRR